MIGAEILDSIGGDIDKCYQNVKLVLANFGSDRKVSITPFFALPSQQEDWNALQFSCSIGDAEVTKTLLSDGANPDSHIKSKVVPQVTSLHIACRYGHLEVVKVLSANADLSKQDQWGYTALHYATVARAKDVVLYLLANGASAIMTSSNGCTAQDLAEQLNFDDIIDALKSKSNLELDPTVPMFRDWLNHLGGGEYAAKFIEAGYDLPFIAKHGVTAEDLDCVGIPASKMGLRRKIATLHELSQFYEAEDEEEEDEDDEEEGDEDDEEEEEEDD